MKAFIFPHELRILSPHQHHFSSHLFLLFLSLTARSYQWSARICMRKSAVDTRSGDDGTGGSQQQKSFQHERKNVFVFRTVVWENRKRNGTSHLLNFFSSPQRYVYTEMAAQHEAWVSFCLGGVSERVKSILSEKRFPSFHRRKVFSSKFSSLSSPTQAHSFMNGVGEYSERLDWLDGEIKSQKFCS